MGRRQIYRPNTAIFGRNYHTSDISASVEHSYQRRHNCTFLKKYYHSPIQQTRTCIFSTVFISTTRPRTSKSYVLNLRTRKVIFCSSKIRTAFMNHLAAIYTLELLRSKLASFHNALHTARSTFCKPKLVRLGTVRPQKTSYLTFLRRLTFTISLRSNHGIILKRSTYCSVGPLFAAQTGPGSYFGMQKADRGSSFGSEKWTPGPDFTRSTIRVTVAIALWSAAAVSRQSDSGLAPWSVLYKYSPGAVYIYGGCETQHKYIYNYS